MSAGDRCPLTSALDLAARGWPVVPLHTPEPGGCSCQNSRCRHPGKHPRIKSWQARATVDARQIRGWWDDWPDANLGILTGGLGNVVALDVDPRNGGDDFLTDLERRHGCLPRTASVSTGGGGQHYYFLMSGQAHSAVIGAGLEFIAERKLIVAPPSLHASGRRYEWDEHPNDTPLAAPPAWLLALIADKRTSYEGPTEIIPQGERNTARSTLIAKKRTSRVASAPIIPKGERNTTLTRIAGRLRLVMPYHEGIYGALHAINTERCRPPLPDAAVRQIARSAGSWATLPWLTSPREFIADPRLSANARLVLRAICDYANARGEAWPSYPQITKLTGIKSPTTILKAVSELEDAGRIKRKRRFNNSTVYHISRSLPGFSTEDPQAPPLVLSFQNLEDGDHKAVDRGSA